jgi:hypothetical protein
MNPNEKEAKVIELLKNGKSFTYIQGQLHVSPSKITFLKRMYLSSDIDICNSSDHGSSGDSGSSSAGSATTTSTESEDNRTNYSIINENESKNNEFSKSINQIKNKMSNNKNYYGKSKSEVEKLKLQLDHKVALKKLALEKEALELKKSELQLKKSVFNNDQQKIEKEGKVLIFRFRKLMSKFKSGIWPFQQIIEYYNNAVSLNEEIEKYCFKEDIDIEGLKILTILNNVISAFEEYVEEINELEAENEKEDMEDENEEDDEYEDDEDEDDEEEDDEDSDLISTPTSLEIIVDKFQENEINEAQSIDFDDYD